MELQTESLSCRIKIIFKVCDHLKAEKKSFFKHFGFNYSLSTIFEIMFISEANLHSESFANI